MVLDADSFYQELDEGEAIKRSKSAATALKEAQLVSLKICQILLPPPHTRPKILAKLKEGVQSVGWTCLDKEVITIPSINLPGYEGTLHA